MRQQNKILRFLIIQTAFIGDVILATPVVEKLHQHFPNGEIDFLLRKGNEQLFHQHPLLREVLVWDKKKNKYNNLFALIRSIRNRQYDYVINLQRFFSTGMITAFSDGKHLIGFDKNPWSGFFTEKVPHRLGNLHEADRNLALIRSLTDAKAQKPRLYPDQSVFQKISVTFPYYCIAPTSVWFTKQWPADRWVALINRLPAAKTIYLLGAPADQAACDHIRAQSTHSRVVNLAGQINLLASAALMARAEMNFVNDSAPLHLASATNAPVVSIFCSTVPNFGFTPLSDESYVVETRLSLACRPCGLHGYARCPEGHFKCSEIRIDAVLSKLKS